MGTFSPSPSMSTAEIDDACKRMLQPVIDGMREEGNPFVGVLYGGLILTDSGVQVLEYNCRFGDPETQVVLPLLAGDLLALLEAAAGGGLAAYLATQPAPTGGPGPWPGAGLTDWSRHAVVVVGAARGYPGSYVRGAPLVLPPDERAAWIVHAGTRRDGDGLATAGGRVLGAVGTGPHLTAARDAAYGLLDRVACDVLFCRRDIAGPARSSEGEG
jgi:phosphoribosylamine-glycine ligase